MVISDSLGRETATNLGHNLRPTHSFPFNLASIENNALSVPNYDKAFSSTNIGVQLFNQLFFCVTDACSITFVHKTLRGKS